ncbi:MAG: carboxypeptidase M32 [candidate division Zixibacteria bacterium]
MSDKAKQLTKELYDLTKEITVLNSCQAILDWDERTYMPPNGSENRANQAALLAGMVHDKFTSPRIGEIINELIYAGIDPEADNVDSANLREIKRAYDKAVKVPKSLVEELSRTITMGQRAWQEAREKSDFPAFQPWMEKIVKLKRQQAEAVGYKGVPYNAMLDDFEPGASTAHITKVFAGLRDELVKLLTKIRESGTKPDGSIITRDYPVERQRQFGTDAAKAIGFNFDSGRLDETVHPFCTGFGPGDIRITTRYDKNHFPQAFFGILHEAGHGIYEQGLPVEYYGAPCGESASLGIHESQSRMWENMVGRSKSFWKHFFPKAQKTFPEALSDVTIDQFHFAVNDVRSSYIRVEADEATYNLHILLRFEMESAFFNGDISVAEVPALWSEKFEKYFGIKPENDKVGCLQDVHWSAGLIGYFPTYTLGNLFAAQFFAKAKEDLGDLDSQFAAGDFKPLFGWLRENIHSYGQRYRADDLVEKITGKPLTHKPLMDYLNTKYGELYKL